jgi:hypothetical protein
MNCSALGASLDPSNSLKVVWSYYHPSGDIDVGQVFWDMLCSQYHTSPSPFFWRITGGFWIQNSGLTMWKNNLFNGHFCFCVPATIPVDTINTSVSALFTSWLLRCFRVSSCALWSSEQIRESCVYCILFLVESEHESLSQQGHRWVSQVFSMSWSLEVWAGLLCLLFLCPGYMSVDIDTCNSEI